MVPEAVSSIISSVCMIITPAPYTKCDACARGKHGNASPAADSISVCVDCLAGKFSSMDGKNNGPCNNCGQGKYSTDVGADKYLWIQ